MFRYSTCLKLRDTDAAGVAFFASYYAIAHDAYEAFLSEQGYSLVSWLDQVHLPIVHSEADYKAPLRLGDAFTIEVTCLRIGERSFTINYDFCVEDKVSASLKTVHVAVQKDQSLKTKAIGLPAKLKSLLTLIEVEA
ncbi:MAG: hypothetical protein CMH49_00505 [Myxococcales bacterium]|nr:hypothetical protein [Myxococcales bacterium]